MSGIDFGAPVFEALGENAVLLRVGDRIDEATNRRVHALASAIAATEPEWLLEVVPAYASLALHVDLDRMDADIEPVEHVRAWWGSLELETDAGNEATSAPFDIPVCYEGEFGADLGALAKHAGLAQDEVIARHLAGDYRVAMLGFAPGFPYLIGLDPQLAMPRMDTPRLRVPAGSVGIGGAQAGIYPREGPGGWRLLGRTPLTLFDATRSAPSLLSPGQRVRFVRIHADEFIRLASKRSQRHAA